MKLLHCTTQGTLSATGVEDGAELRFFFSHNRHVHGSLDSLSERDVLDLIALAQEVLESSRRNRRMGMARW